jgi:hypothetical protein
VQISDAVLFRALAAVHVDRVAAHLHADFGAAALSPVADSMRGKSAGLLSSSTALVTKARISSSV